MEDNEAKMQAMKKGYDKKIKDLRIQVFDIMKQRGQAEASAAIGNTTGDQSDRGQAPTPSFNSPKQQRRIETWQQEKLAEKYYLIFAWNNCHKPIT